MQLSNAQSPKMGAANDINLKDVCAGLAVFLLSLLVISCQTDDQSEVSSLQLEPQPKDARISVGPTWVTSQMLELPGNDADPSDFQTRIVHDRLLALHLRELKSPQTKVSARAVMARAYLEHRLKIAADKGEVAESEKEELQQRLKNILSRPRLVRTAEAFVPFKLIESEEVPYTLAREILESVQDSTSLQSWVEGVRAIETNVPFEVIARPPVSANGEVFRLSPADYGPVLMTSEYGAAAAECLEDTVLPKLVGDENGFHVVFCIKIFDELKRTAEDSDELQRVTLKSLRASAEVSKYRENAQKDVRINIRPDLENLTRLVWKDRVSE